MHEVHLCFLFEENIVFFFLFTRKILELEEELKVVGNNMKSLEVSEQEVTQFELSHIRRIQICLLCIYICKYVYRLCNVRKVMKNKSVTYPRVLRM